MARRKARRNGSKKLEPAVKELWFSLTNEEFEAGTFGNLNTDYISLSQVCSIVNRRFYRAGLNWAVAGFDIYSAAVAAGNTGGAGSFTVLKIPDTWIASNAWHKGFAHWNELNNRALETSESVKAKFTDFKVYMDPAHHQAGVLGNLMPIDGDGNIAISGEWQYSQISLPAPTAATPDNTTEADIIWTGGNWPGVSAATGLDAVSLIDGYSASRALPDIQDPNAPTDARIVDGQQPENWLAAIDNEGSKQIDDVLTDLTLQNDQAPYPFENGDDQAGGVWTDTMYPGGPNQLPGLQILDVARVTGTTIGAHTTLNGSNFQGGLIKITNSCDDLNKWSIAPLLKITLVPGDHRGYLCQPMQDV